MNPIALDFRYLKAFIVTCKHLNFSKAAEELNIAQSAVSRQIKLLEESVGKQLIIRSSKKVLLTDEGAMLLEEVKQFEDRVEEIFFGDNNKTIRVGILHGLLENWFNDIIVDFTKKYPQQLNVEINNLTLLKEKLQDGKYDLIFTTENIQSELLSSLKLFEEKFVLISKNEINPKEAFNHPWIMYAEHDHFFQLYKKRPSKTLVVNSITTMINLVRQGVGIAIVPDHTVNDKSLNVYELKNLPKQYIYLSTLNHKTMPGHIKLLIDATKKKI